MPPTRFGRDPDIKVECAWTGLTLGRANGFAERRRTSVRVRDQKGRWVDWPRTLAASDSMLTQCGNVADGFELLLLREQMRAWRLYDQFRTDPGAPARQRQVGTSTPVLSADGADLAAAVATIEEIGAAEELAATVADAIPGGSVGVRDVDGLFELEMRQHGLLRPLRAAELSDGTLRDLLLVAALLTPRPPPLMVLNEPETSLHPDLLAPLARMISRAAERSQVVVVSHARALALALLEAGAWSVTLGKELGETVVLDGQPPPWAWAPANRDQRGSLEMRQHGWLRPLRAAELSGRPPPSTIPPSFLAGNSLGASEGTVGPLLIGLAGTQLGSPGDGHDAYPFRGDPSLASDSGLASHCGRPGRRDRQGDRSRGPACARDGRRTGTASRSRPTSSTSRVSMTGSSAAG